MKRRTIRTIPADRLTMPVPGRDHIKGRATAPLALIEFGDYECPYCSEANSIVKTIQKRLGKRLCFAFRNFPLANKHLHAEHAAEAAEAAGAQGKFWEMRELLFEYQDALEDEDLGEYAASLGLDEKRLIREVVAGAYSARIKEDIRSGARAGVDGTPTFFVNGVRFDDATEVDFLLAALTAENPS